MTTPPAFTLGQSVQDIRAGSIGEVVHVSDRIVRVRWANNDESVFVRPAAEQWLRVVSYELAQLPKEPR